MPTWNQAETLIEALCSVRPQVEQLIAVDDGNTDGTRSMLQQAEYLAGNITVASHHHNMGAAAAINTGRALVGEADWVTWVSSDNVALPGWRDALITVAKSAPNIGAVYSSFTIDDGRGRWQYNAPAMPIGNIESLDCHYGPSFIIRADVWTKDLEHRAGPAHDYDHWLRVEEKCAAMGLRIVGIPDALVLYRLRHREPEEHAAIRASAAKYNLEAKARRGAA